MRKEILIDGLGILKYEESFLTGKKTVSVDGVAAVKADKHCFVLGDKSIFISGNFFSGLKLTVDGREYWVYEKTAVYEYILALLPFVFSMVWGNVPALFNIFPIVAGAIGGAVTVAVGFLEIGIFRMLKKPIVKVAVSLAVFAATILLLFLLATALVSLLA